MKNLLGFSKKHGFMLNGVCAMEGPHWRFVMEFFYILRHTGKSTDWFILFGLRHSISNMIVNCEQFF